MAVAGATLTASGAIQYWVYSRRQETADEETSNGLALAALGLATVGIMLTAYSIWEPNLDWDEAELDTDLAYLREIPSTNLPPLRTLVGRDGDTIEVAGDDKAGWYRVRVDGLDGWLFGVFLLPPRDGYLIAQTRTLQHAILLDSNGNQTGYTNGTSSKVLVTSTDGSLWEVVVPSGGRFYVDPAEFRVIGSP